MTLLNKKRLIGRPIDGTDKEIGKVIDLFFDDRDWVVRYLVVDTGGWLTGRKVLIAPEAVRGKIPERGSIPVALTAKQIQDSPDIGDDLPVSRQKEVEVTRWFGWLPYWDPSLDPLHSWPPALTPGLSPEGMESSGGDPHLRSVTEVIGYTVAAKGDPVGTVDDVLARVATWCLDYIVVDTGSLLSRQYVPVAPHWVSQVSWAEREIRVDLTAGQINTSPQIDLSSPIDTRFELALWTHYDREIPERLPVSTRCQGRCEPASDGRE